MDIASFINTKSLSDTASDLAEALTGPITSEMSKTDVGSVDLSKTVYVICEKQSFRSDAFLAMLSCEYNTEIIYTVSGKIPEITDPLCFIIDVASFAGNMFAQKILVYVKDVAYDSNVHIFLIGEPEELSAVGSLVDVKNGSVTMFERPIDANECIIQIKDKLVNSPIVRRKKHIMVVDDSVTFLKLIKKSLEKNYQVTLAASAYECIREITKQGSPDLIIIDQMMPTVDGLTLCKMIREQPELQGVSLIVYSGTSDVDLMIDFMPFVDGYLPKTEPAVKLNSYVEEVFRAKKKEKRSKKDKKRKKLA